MNASINYIVTARLHTENFSKSYKTLLSAYASMSDLVSEGALDVHIHVVPSCQDYVNYYFSNVDELVSALSQNPSARFDLSFVQDDFSTGEGKNSILSVMSDFTLSQVVDVLLSRLSKYVDSWLMVPAQNGKEVNPLKYTVMFQDGFYLEIEPSAK